MYYIHIFSVNFSGVGFGLSVFIVCTGMIVWCGRSTEISTRCLCGGGSFLVHLGWLITGHLFGCLSFLLFLGIVCTDKKHFVKTTKKPTINQNAYLLLAGWPGRGWGLLVFARCGGRRRHLLRHHCVVHFLCLHGL